eukprot:GILI01009458.1.p1 GENE.GILI01009458.1~~GILI01009458.1.p1  ORF type:complete len:303 (-),score=62.28 GILI01009458.1:85-993(-)
MSRQVPLVCPGHTKSIIQLYYSPVTPDGVFLISACKDNKPMLRNGETGDWIGTFEGHKGAVWGVHLNDAATRAVTGSADFSVRVWDALTGDEMHVFEHRHVVKAVQFSKDSSRILTGGQEKLLRVYDLANPTAAPLAMAGHTEGVKVAVWGADPNLIISGSAEPRLRIWDVRTGAEQRQVDLPGPVMDIELSRDERTLTVAAGQSVVFLDAQTLEVKSSHQLNIDLESASLHPAGELFVTGEGKNNWVRVFDVRTGQEKECHKGHHGPVHATRFHPLGHNYASGSDDGTIRIWQTLVESGEQ